MLRTLSLLLALSILFGGCVNRRGISTTYYNECREYYDVQGYHHKVCDKNMVEFDDLSDGVKSLGEEPKKSPPPKVW